MKLDKLLKELREKRSRLVAEGHHPVFTIYMEYLFWLECKNELRGEMSTISYEFVVEDTIEGSKVWHVASLVTSNGKSVTHPPFVIHCQSD
jgi:hypothetical protein